MQRFAWSSDEEDWEGVGVGVAVEGAVSPGFTDDEDEFPCAVPERRALPAGLVLSPDWMYDIAKPQQAAAEACAGDASHAHAMDAADGTRCTDAEDGAGSWHSSDVVSVDTALDGMSLTERQGPVSCRFTFKNRLPPAYPGQSTEDHIEAVMGFGMADQS